MIFLFIIATIVQLMYYWGIFSQLAWHRPLKLVQQHKATKPLSIIICAKNEALNLEKYLPSIVQQNYPNFEVIVVNDHSTDNTMQVLKHFAKHYPHLKIIDSPDAKTGKKQALAQGIAAAQYEQLLLTDADCLPASNAWLQLMSSTLNQQATTDIVLAYAPYLTDNSFLNKCIQFETSLTAIQYLSYALCGTPYMGVGRNLAYKKSLFIKANGFQSHQQVLSGDDDLFINQIAHQHNTRILVHPKSFCYSKPPTTWRAWYQQKKRHLSTAKHYRLAHQLMLGLFSISHFLFYGMLIVGFILQTHISLLLILYLLRFISQMWLYNKILQKFQLRNLLYWIPLLDFLYCFYYLVLSPSLFLNKKIKWKH